MTDQFDVAIIGGGFSGLALARESSFHGFKTVLFEAEKFGGGTSANSLRIVHGGFRYLQTLSLDRVLQSARAQNLALARYSDFVHPLPCLMPLEGAGLKSAFPVRAALAAYHRMTGTPAERRGSVLSKSESEEAAPALKGVVPHGALRWWDAVVTDLDGLIAHLCAECSNHGVALRSGSAVSSVLIESAHATVTVAGELVPAAAAKVVVNMAGPAVGSISVPGAERARVQWCRGFNLVFDTEFDPTYAIAGKGRGRLLFAVPRGSGTAIGTWYLPASNTHSTEVSESEIQSAIEDIAAAFPAFHPERPHLTGIECGILPVSKFTRDEPMPLGRERLIVSGRYAELISTKFTTFEVQAQGILRRLAPLLQ